VPQTPQDAEMVSTETVFSTPLAAFAENNREEKEK
jgi:hypothetical protein